MLDKNVAADVLEAALSTGGDFAEIYMEQAISTGIGMVNGVVEKATSGISYGCGVRIFSCTKVIYAYTSNTSAENLIKLAKEAAEAVSYGKTASIIPWINRVVPNNHIIKNMPNTVVKKEVIALLRQAHSASVAHDPLITQTGHGYSDVIKDVLIANSEGLWASDRRVLTRVRVTAVASQGDEKQTGSCGPGAHCGFELFSGLNMEDLGRQCAQTAVTMLKADFCPGGIMPVVIENGFGGVIFHEACGHSLEATSVAKGASEFADKMNQQIAADCVTAIDDGTIPNAWGSQNIDDEGMPTRKNILIEKGMLKSFLIDKMGGIKMGMEPTGSARRESYKFPPTSRMSNTYIANGPHTPEEIIAATEYGLYAKKMGGGSVQPATGEFNFAVQEGYLIRNGKIAEPVRGATLIGKGSQVLMDIDKVGNNMLQEQGVCGSISGGVPTNCGQPIIRVKALTVGGRN